MVPHVKWIRLSETYAQRGFCSLEFEMFQKMTLSGTQSHRNTCYTEQIVLLSLSHLGPSKLTIYSHMDWRFWGREGRDGRPEKQRPRFCHFSLRSPAGQSSLCVYTYRVATSKSSFPFEWSINSAESLSLAHSCSQFRSCWAERSAKPTVRSHLVFLKAGASLNFLLGAKK